MGLFTMKFTIEQKRFLSLGDAWAGNSVNAVPFRTGVVTDDERRVTAFYDPNGDILVFEESLESGDTEHLLIPNSIKPFDAHRCVSIGVDQRRMLHIAYGAHASSMAVARSKTSLLRDGFEDISTIAGAITYPMFLRLCDSELILIFREGGPTEGEIKLSRLNCHTGLWTAEGTALISGIGSPFSCGPYINTPAQDESGALALFLMWRLDAARTSGGQAVNVGIDCLISRDGLRSATSIHDVELSLPVGPTNSERVIAVPIGRSLINQSSAAIFPKFKPAVVSYWAGNDGIPQYRLGWYDGDRWRLSTVSTFKTEFKLDGRGTLPLPHSRPELLADDDGRAVLIYRSQEESNRLCVRILDPPDYALAGSAMKILVDADLGYYEPVLDRRAWELRKEIVLYVQRCEQQLGGDDRQIFKAEPAFLGTWTLDTSFQPAWRGWVSYLSDTMRGRN
jgi:hypothetical protein